MPVEPRGQVHLGDYRDPGLTHGEPNVFVVRHSAMTDTRRFAAVFATTAAVAALAGGVGGLVLGQSHHAAPTVSVVGSVR